MKLIDLSVTIEHDAVTELVPPKIEFRAHDGAGLDIFRNAFGVTPEDLVYSGGLGPGEEIFTFMSHTGTHVDAPFHYGPRSADGSPAKTIDELPLEWFHGDGVVLDLRRRGLQCVPPPTPPARILCPSTPNSRNVCAASAMGCTPWSPSQGTA